jgi:hypothetical protein
MRELIKYRIALLALYFLWTCMGCDGSGTKYENV